MNHLAHALVAHRTGGSIVGNLMGDFVKGRPQDRYEGEILRGILLHREIDAFTDRHDVFAKSRRRIPHPYRRFSGILIDLFYDHRLANRWSEFSEMALSDFTKLVHSQLRESFDILPPRMQRFVRYMLETDLLVSYRELDGVSRALSGIASRLTRDTVLARAHDALAAQAPELDRDFTEFFPQLMAHCRSGGERSLSSARELRAGNRPTARSGRPPRAA